MRKLVLAVLVALLCLGEGIQVARADGAVFPVDLNTGYLVVHYHHVTVNIDGPHAVTHVEQEFYNPYGFPVAGRYLFPVPPGATLSRFQATLDGQDQAFTRQDATTTNQALRPLVVSRRDPRLLQYIDWETMAFNLNLPPGGSRRMVLEYEQVLAPAGGMYHYRYILSTESYSAQPLQEVSLTVNLRSPGGLASVYSASHPFTIVRSTPEQALVRWQAADVLPAEDFDLFFASAQAGFGGGLLTGRRADRNHFLFLFSPQDNLDVGQYLPKDIVFIMDRSGSMQGAKIEQARNALRYFVSRLGAEDRFAVLSFNERVTRLADHLQDPAGSSLAYARRYIDDLNAGGSTDLAAALHEGLAVLGRSEPRVGATRLIVFLTDGLPTAGITDPDVIVRQMQAANQELAARIHVFGVGYDVNTHLLDRLAADNGGTVNYVQPGEDLEQSLQAFYDRVAHPVLTDIRVTFDGMEAHELYPQAAPDLFAGSSLLLSGTYWATGPAVTVHVRGMTGDQPREFSYTFDLGQTGDHDFVARLWATRRIGDLLDGVRVSGEDQATVAAIRELGLAYGVITPYTNFVIAAQAQGAASAANMQLYQDQSSLNQMSGRVTIQARVQNQAYQQAEQASLAAGANILNRRQYSIAQLDRVQPGGLSVDLALLQHANPGDRPLSLDWIQQNLKIDRAVDFGSEEYFKLAADPQVRPALQAGVNVVFAYQGQVVQVQDHNAAPAASRAPVRIAGQFSITLPGQLDRWLAQAWPTVRDMLDHARSANQQ